MRTCWEDPVSAFLFTVNFGLTIGDLLPPKLTVQSTWFSLLLG